jgi:hypothetical protein
MTRKELLALCVVSNELTPVSFSNFQPNLLAQNENIVRGLNGLWLASGRHPQTWSNQIQTSLSPEKILCPFIFKHPFVI